MAREKQGYRDVIMQLNEMYPGKGMLTRGEVAKFMGVNRSTVWRRGIKFNDVTGKVTIPDLARQICL